MVQHRRVRRSAAVRHRHQLAQPDSRPGYRNLDVAVVRRVPLPRRTALELRAEVFNATNTPPLGAPNATVGSAAFGTITTAGDPRVIQLALKVLF